MLETEIYEEDNLESKRKLASIQTIDDIRPIENADNIVLATIGGWRAVVKKDEFVPGDKCVYHEIDSLLPDHPHYEFMRQRDFRVKSMKLRGCLSQGLALPVSILSDFGYTGVYDLDEDVTAVIGVRKYEHPLRNSGNANHGRPKGNFPSFCVKTDEERIQGQKKLLEEQLGAEVYVAEKTDGSSTTFYFKDGCWGVCSRNLELKEETSGAYWDLFNSLDMRNRIKDNEFDFFIQGEMVGPQVQGNKYKLKERKLFVFNVFNMKEHRFLDLDELLAFCEKYGLSTVPILDRIKLHSDMDAWLAYAEGKSVLNKDTEREGVVVRPVKETYSSVMRGRFSFKIISNRFLLKQGE